MRLCRWPRSVTCRPATADSRPGAHALPPSLPLRRSKLVGEGSAACLMGLAVGLLLLVSQKLIHEEILQAILQFDVENFFMWVQ